MKLPTLTLGRGQRNYSQFTIAFCQPIMRFKNTEIEEMQMIKLINI